MFCIDKCVILFLLLFFNEYLCIFVEEKLAGWGPRPKWFGLFQLRGSLTSVGLSEASGYQAPIWNGVSCEERREPWGWKVKGKCTAATAGWCDTPHEPS